MHYLPGAFFWPKDHRSSQCERGYLRASAKLGLHPLYLHNIGKFSSHVLLHYLDFNDLTISGLRCGMSCGLSDLIPSMRNRADSTYGRAKRVSEGYVLSMREKLLHRLGVTFRELTCR